VTVAGEAFGRLQALGMLLVLGGVVAGQPGTVAWVRRRLDVKRRRAPRRLAPTCAEAPR
jgi:probable blue pigment (indigoidine) exporter